MWKVNGTAPRHHTKNQELQSSLYSIYWKVTSGIPWPQWQNGKAPQEFATESFHACISAKSGGFCESSILGSLACNRPVMQQLHQATPGETSKWWMDQPSISTLFNMAAWECAVIKLMSHGHELTCSQFSWVSQTTSHPRSFESSLRKYHLTTLFTLTLVTVPRSHGVQTLPLLTTLKLLACRLTCTSQLHGEWPKTWKTRISMMTINEL